MVKNRKKIELLAPAGNILKMKTAIAYGADAVYLGIPDFSLRVRINDFNLKTLKEAIKMTHEHKKRVYVTVNIFAHNKHLEKIKPYLKELNNIKPDALIVSDPGLISLIKRLCPKIDIHLSTQANCTNYEAVKFWQKQGVKRIILGREVTLKEIKEINKHCPKMELEYFVHGAMCMSYSGRCFLSKDFVGRSANLGDCVQPCRWEYDVFIKAKGHEDILELVEEEHGTYLLNSKDLCLIRHVGDLIKAGVSSLKIEGRAKSIYYLANIVAMYKKAINDPKKADFLYKELLNKVTHRGYTNGFLLEDKAEQNTSDSHFISDWEFCGQVISVKKNGNPNILKIKVHNTIKVGDLVEIVLPEYSIIKFNVKKIIDFKSGNEILEAHGGGGGQEIVLEVKSKFNIPELAVLRRKIK
ncbi:peptidase U32 [Candidatus Falkowbacteria bacterium HGW-Falkowbacteria-1]|uniref:Peptidase U32 n=1 Tax=Candidatus Falkowbacteria bacterium HGW-Falkowbacteria-1 TaxID=2013768 RepID=A0A2N2E9Y4_9BACT|nr:MAG: peptidase U32 [Candidatus Falkowbacteria bacterium HGW-Falkowbacteria-1]